MMESTWKSENRDQEEGAEHGSKTLLSFLDVSCTAGKREAISWRLYFHGMLAKWTSPWPGGCCPSFAIEISKWWGSEWPRCSEQQLPVQLLNASYALRTNLAANRFSEATLRSMRASGIAYRVCRTLGLWWCSDHGHSRVHVQKTHEQLSARFHFLALLTTNQHFFLNHFWWDLITLDDIWWSLMTFDYIWWHLVTFDDLWWHLIIFDDIWWHLMISDDIWWHLMIPDDIWWHLMTFDDLWWHLMVFDGIWWHLMTFDDIWWHLMILWWFFDDIFTPRCG